MSDLESENDLGELIRYFDYLSNIPEHDPLDPENVTKYALDFLKTCDLSEIGMREIHHEEFLFKLFGVDESNGVHTNAAIYKGTRFLQAFYFYPGGYHGPMFPN